MLGNTKSLWTAVKAAKEIGSENNIPFISVCTNLRRFRVRIDLAGADYLTDNDNISGIFFGAM